MAPLLAEGAGGALRLRSFPTMMSHLLLRSVAAEAAVGVAAVGAAACGPARCAPTPAIAAPARAARSATTRDSQHPLTHTHNVLFNLKFIFRRVAIHQPPQLSLQPHHHPLAGGRAAQVIISDTSINLGHFRLCGVDSPLPYRQEQRCCNHNPAFVKAETLEKGAGGGGGGAVTLMCRLVRVS